jgi:hypothetical protein
VSSTPEHFARVAGRVNLGLLASRRVVIVGVGTVGSPIARELAFAGVGRLRLIDGDGLEVSNLARHALNQHYVGQNKAEGMASFLHGLIPTVHVEFLAQDVDSRLSDSQLDDLLADADLVVAATDNRDVQRRLGRRALALDVPAIFPALYGGGGGEVFVSYGPAGACFLCWDAFRTGSADLRAVTALGAEAMSVISLAVHVALGLLDGQSAFARLLAGTTADRRPRNLFVLNPFAALQYAVVEHRPDCASCAVGPSLRQRAVSEQSPEVVVQSPGPTRHRWRLLAWFIFLSGLAISVATGVFWEFSRSTAGSVIILLFAGYWAIRLIRWFINSEEGTGNTR